MFALQSVTKRFGGQVVLDETSWAPPHIGVIGLVGPNGAGKTTLLRILVGDEEIDSGTLAIPTAMTIGYLPQELDQADASGSILDVVLSGRRDLLELEAREEALRRDLEHASTTASVMEHSEVLEQLEQRGGYTFRAMARQIAAGLGFDDSALDRPISTFSGGWRMRALLGRLLLQKPNVLLLDEPTNHLDTESMEWLENFLGRYEGLVIVVSHDRYFLNRMATQIVELQTARITSYPGNWDAYRERKADEIERRTAAAARQEKEVEKVRQFIERFRYKATKSKQVQSRVKALEKIERVEVPTDDLRDIEFRFPQPPRTPKVVAEVTNLSKRFGEVVVWESLNLAIHRGEKVALMGPNGAGKTTLLRILAGVLSADGGEVRVPDNVRVAYFAQHAVDQLDAKNTVLDELMRASDIDTSARVRTILGAFGFSGAEVEKRIGVLSGGEKNRVALAKMMLEPAGLLLLDEPTNHLDIESRQVLEFALRDFDGAFVVVSHDRYFVNEVAQRVIHLEHGTATDYLGDYEYYKWKRDEQHQRESAERAAEREAAGDNSGSGSVSKKDARRAAAELREAKKQATKSLRKEVATLEGRIEELELLLAEAEQKLSDPSVYEDESTAKKYSTQYRQATDELTSTMELWETRSAELEEAERRVEEAF